LAPLTSPDWPWSPVWSFWLAGNKAINAGLVTTLLRDIQARVNRANHEVNDGGTSARSAIGEVESQIGNQLTEIQQQGEFSGDNAAQLTNTLRAVQSGPSGQSGDTNNSNGTDGSNGTNGNSDSNQP
jgi:hypothetical protein